MQVRPKARLKSVRRRGPSPMGAGGARGAHAEHEAPAAAQAPAEAQPQASAAALPPVPGPDRRFDDSAPDRRRLHGRTQDTAVYCCHCGYVFEAPVTTSVGCPHCGDGQAW